MQTSKKKPSMVFLLLGAVLAGYLGYLIGGAWEQGIDLMEFMDRFNVVCAAPFANYLHPVYRICHSGAIKKTLLFSF